VAYFIQTADSVESYIRDLQGLSEKGKKLVIDGYLSDLAERADQFLQRYPLTHESYLFQYEHALIDNDIIYSFRFIANGSHMPMGVVQVIYVDHDTMAVPE
jgi:hypothetical protein